MVTIFFILVALVIFHFFYEAILAPSLKFEIKLKLFRLRDELRRIKIENRNLLSDEIFLEIQEGLNRQIQYFDGFNIVNVIRTYISIKDNKELDKRVWQFNERLRECPIPEVKEIHSKSMLLFWETVKTNNGGMVAFILPVYLALKICELLGYLFSKAKIYIFENYRSTIYTKFALQATRMLETPEVVFSQTFEKAF